MPIKVPNNLPAIETLTNENVFVMTDTRAMTQDIRPLQILILNLMPTKIETETQLTRLLGNTPLQVELELLQTSTHKASNISEEHMIAFYKTFNQIKNKFYDGMIITGAPVELMDFEEVDYWEELCEIMEWSKRHVHNTFHICWGAQAGLYYHYGIQKRILPKKLSGVYKHTLDYKNGMLFRGFDDEFFVPHSRNTTVDREDIEAVKGLKIISSSPEAGVFAVKSENDRQIFIMGHSEYDANTLYKEYIRDKNAGLNPEVPANYFPDDDDTKEPVVKWRSCANLLYSNWLNYFVYQTTQYDINRIDDDSLADVFRQKVDCKVAKFGGSSLADAGQIEKVADIIKSQPERKYVVVSAPGKRYSGDIKVTDMLINLCEKPGNADAQIAMIKERFDSIKEGLGLDIDLKEDFDAIRRTVGKKYERDFVVSRGEYLNAKILAAFIGYDFVDAADVVFFDEEGNYDEETTNKAFAEVFKNHKNAVIPGFYGSMPDGLIKTFPRGGSDITGAIVSAAAGADIYENWTDVSGLLMADPTIIDNPLTVPVMTYKELRELSYMGAAVMHEDTIFPVVKLEIPINIRNTNRPEDNGTLIVKNADYYLNSLMISGISGKENYSLMVIEKPKLNIDSQIQSRIIEIFGDKGITIENILAGIDTLSITLSSLDMRKWEDVLMKDIEAVVGDAKITVSKDVALIAVVGRDMGTTPAVAAKVLEALATAKIQIKLLDHGSDKINMIAGVDGADYKFAVQAIYSEFARR